MRSSSKILKFAEYFCLETRSVYLKLPGGPFVKIAMRALDAVLKRVDMPIYVDNVGGGFLLTALKIENGNMKTVGLCAINEPNMEMNPEFNQSDWARLQAVYAPEAWTALYLLGAGVYYATAIMGKKGVIPDNSLTTDAQKIVSRIFATGQENGTVVPDVLKAQGQNINHPYLRAGYLQPSIDSSKYAQAFEMGKRIKDATPQQYQSMILESVLGQWYPAYEESKAKGGVIEQTIQDPSKTVKEEILTSDQPEQLKENPEEKGWKLPWK